MSKKCHYTIVVSISILFLILSIGSIFIFSNIDFFINEQVKKQAPFLNGSKTFQKWSHPSSDTSFKYSIFLFNVTNPDEVASKFETPIVNEMGPYEFNQKKIYQIYNWDLNETELNYKMKRSFDRDSTCKGDLNDEVTVLNVPLITFANLIKNKTTNGFVNRIMRHELKQYPMFVTRRVGDLLFDGYKDDLTKFLAKMDRFVKKISKIMHIKVDSPTAISKEGVFSLLGQKNNTDFGLWTINTGHKDLDKLGKLVLLNGKDKLGCWSGNCSSISGTDGLVHHPFVKDSDILPVFEPELNRTIFLEFERNTNYNGIPTKRFLLSESTYASPDNNPYNECFCPTNDQIKDFNGTLRVADCNQEVPMVFSNPHFYQAADYFREHIKGFEPDKAKHESFAEISAELGMVLNGRKTVQLNMDTAAYHFYFEEENKRQIFPIFWLSDSGSAGPSSINELKEELYDKVANIRKYLIIFTALFIAGSIVPIIYLIIDVTTYVRTVEDTQRIIDEDFSNNSEDEVKDSHDRTNETIEYNNRKNETINHFNQESGPVDV